MIPLPLAPPFLPDEFGDGEGDSEGDGEGEGDGDCDCNSDAGRARGRVSDGGDIVSDGGGDGGMTTIATFKPRKQ